MLTRPERSAWQNVLRQYRQKILDGDHTELFPLNVMEHPKLVRGRSIQIYTTKSLGVSLMNRETNMRISTIGQTFLDMFQKPNLCGGMSHVLEVCEEHGMTYLSQIVPVIDSSSSVTAKSRAGYIFQEYLGLEHTLIEKWKILSQRGGSRKLDPSKEFASTYSEIWMLSINV